MGELFWRTKREFAEKCDTCFVNQDGDAPEGEQEFKEEFRANLDTVRSMLLHDKELVTFLANSLVRIGESAPGRPEGFRLGKSSPYSDTRVFDFRTYPKELLAAPGEQPANRPALAKWGAWINAFGATYCGRPLFLASSADLSGSANISGFAKPFGDFPWYGWYERTGTDEGALQPQTTTGFSNSGISEGIAATNLAEDPAKDFNGYWAIASTYGSFSYLLYGMNRLYSQMAEDSEYRVGKVVWIAGHSGPETADDSRTHFGIFSPGVTQLFPKGSVIDIRPWEHNEVLVVLGAALAARAPIVILHLTLPPVEIPNRSALPSRTTSRRHAEPTSERSRPEPPPRRSFFCSANERDGGVAQDTGSDRQIALERQDRLRLEY